MMAYEAMAYCLRGCTYTIMGDVSQNIHFQYGLNDWEELKKLMLSSYPDGFGLLKKSYRNTVEIANFATEISAMEISQCILLNRLIVMENRCAWWSAAALRDD